MGFANCLTILPHVDQYLSVIDYFPNKNNASIIYNFHDYKSSLGNY